ncbi:MAG TPA: ATP-binding protein [Armatimonadota bacterium]|nr:ATP-binding protein [Armatimonadota bacterium]
MNTDQFTELLGHGEDTWLDWKRDFPAGLLAGSKNPDWDKGKGTLLKDLVAIANGEGEPIGYLIYGVKDTGSSREVHGISTHWDDADFQAFAEAAFDPPPRFRYTEIEYEAKRIGIFHIERIPEYPHVCTKSMGGAIYDGQVWYRRGSRNTIAHREDLRRMAIGHEPFKFQSLREPPLESLFKELQAQGHEPTYLHLSNKDSNLAMGYQLVYFPGTRREIWVGYHWGEYELIMMLRPPKLKT